MIRYYNTILLINMYITSVMHDESDKIVDMERNP